MRNFWQRVLCFSMLVYITGEFLCMGQVSEVTSQTIRAEVQIGSNLYVGPCYQWMTNHQFSYSGNKGGFLFLGNMFTNGAVTLGGPLYGMIMAGQFGGGVTATAQPYGVTISGASGTGSLITVELASQGSEFRGYNYAGPGSTVTFGAGSDGASFRGFNQSSADLGADGCGFQGNNAGIIRFSSTAYGAHIFGYGIGGTNDTRRSGAMYFGELSGIYSNNQAGAIFAGRNVGRVVNSGYGSVILGQNGQYTTVTNLGDAAILLMPATWEHSFGVTSATITAFGVGSILSGSGVASNQHCIVLGDGAESHGNFSVTADKLHAAADIVATRDLYLRYDSSVDGAWKLRYTNGTVVLQINTGGVWATANTFTAP